MIFIAILDPRFSRFSNETIEKAIRQNRGYQVHRSWCVTWCQQHGQRLNEVLLATTDNNFNPIECSGTITATLQRALNCGGHDKEYETEYVYIYVFSHGVTREEGQFIKLNENAYISDSTFMKLIMNNHVQHVSVFLETCHSSGMYDPSSDWYVPEFSLAKPQPRFKYDYRKLYRVCFMNNTPYLCSYTSNVTVFSSSVSEDKCKTLIFNVPNTIGAIGYATMAIYDTIQNNSMFDFTPFEIRDIVNGYNHEIKESQYAQVHSPEFVPTWF